MALKAIIAVIYLQAKNSRKALEMAAALLGCLVKANYCLFLLLYRRYTLPDSASKNTSPVGATTALRQRS